MSTRDNILDAALELFNEQGTAAVSTNHIAAAINISPGNLYYHFRNKQDIIRSLFERLFAAWGETYQLPPDRRVRGADRCICQRRGPDPTQDPSRARGVDRTMLDDQ
jgi:AcrR family transcriptional regulator